MSTPFHLIGESLAALGTPAFTLRVLDLAHMTGARQLMVFEHGNTWARCLLSRNYAREGLGEVLSERYLNGWFRKDPLRPALLRLAPGQRRVQRIEAQGSRVNATYRRLFFDDAGLAGKTAVLVAGQWRRLIVNLYDDATSGPIDADLADLIAQLIARHHDSAEDPLFPPALEALSERERAVCLQILNGQTTEAIAGALSVSPATVTTYRKRAYQKLGIHSRSALFAICRKNGA